MPEEEESGFAQTVLPRRAGQVYWGTAVSTLADLRNIAYESRRNNQLIFCREVPGVFWHDQNATDSEDSPSIIEPTDGLGRWVLLFGVAGTTGSSLLLYNGSSTPGSPAAGDIWYDTNTNQWRGYNGTDWNTILG